MTFRKRSKNYAWTLVAVGAALLLRVILTQLTGLGLATYVTFYPAVIIVALVCGLGPGLVATVTAALVVDYFVIPPTWQFGFTNAADAVGLALFFGMGILMSVVAGLYHQSREKLAAYEQSRPLPGSHPAPRILSAQALLINAGFAVSLIIIAFIGWQSLQSMQNETAATQWTTHSYQVTEKLDQLLTKLLDAETGERGFIITGDERYLQSYQASLAEIESNIAATRKLTQDNPNQQKRLDDIEKLKREKFDMMTKVIELRRSQGFAAASDVVATGKGKALMDAIRDIASQMRDEETQLLGERSANREAASSRIVKIILAGNLLSLCIIVTVFVFLKQENIRRQQTETELARNRDQLEETVASRTIELKQSQESLQKLNVELEQRVTEQVSLIRRVNETLEVRIAERTAEIQAANVTLRTSRLAALNLMEDALDARRQVEQAQERLDLAIKAANMGVWRWEIIEDKRYFDNQTCLLLGIDASTFAGAAEEFFRVVHPEYRDKLKLSLARTIEHNIPYESEYKVTWPDGSVHYITARGRLARDEDGRPLRINGIIWDITERKKMEEELRKSRDELEIRVKERTEDLDEAVIDLQKQVEYRIKAEETAKAERKRLENVLETLPNYVCLLTPDYRMPFANRVFRETFGYYPDKKCYEFLFNRKEPCEDCQTYTVLKTNKPQRWEWTGPNGHNYDIYDYPFTDTDGSRLILEMGIDITEQKKAVKAVREGEERYRSLTEATTQIVWTTDAQGQVVGDMPLWREFTGQTIEEMQGWGWINSLHPDDRERTSKIWTQSIQNKTLYETEYRIRRNDGEYRYVSVRGVPVLEQDGSIREWIGTCTDIVERKLAAERQGVTSSLLELYVKKSSRREYLDSAVEAVRNWSGCSRVGIRIKDEKGNIPYESSVGYEKDFLAMENPLNLSRDKCLCMRAILQEPVEQDKTLLATGGSFYTNDSLAFVKSLSPQEVKDYRGNCMRKGFQSIAVVPIRYRDEVLGVIHLADSQKNMVPLTKVQFIETTVSPLIGEAIHRFNAEAELEKYRLHLEDLVKNRTEELSRSNKDLEQFAYVASHDLQEPLRAVSGFVELLRRNLDKHLDEKTNEYMNFTIDGAKRMQSLINGLLEYSRIGTQGKKPQRVNSKDALDEALARLHASIGESGAKITADDLPMVYFDDMQLTRLFQNLVGNAIKFRSDETPQIHVSAVRKDGSWQFAVHDNGIGIEPQYAERIFMIFQRLHTRKIYPGTGIGLSICKKIVERHGGKIWVESTQGHGSTFYFTVPDAEEALNV